MVYLNEDGTTAFGPVVDFGSTPAGKSKFREKAIKEYINNGGYHIVFCPKCNSHKNFELMDADTRLLFECPVCHHTCDYQIVISDIKIRSFLESSSKINLNPGDIIPLEGFTIFNCYVGDLSVERVDPD